MENLGIRHIKLSICIAVDCDGKYYNTLINAGKIKVSILFPYLLFSLGVKYAYIV